MNPWRISVWLLTLALFGPASRPLVNAQVVADAQPPATTKSPVDTFRELLAMTPEQRILALASRPDETRPLLGAKLREYESLTPEARKLRLRATELRWWLLRLMHQPATNRTALLNGVPADLRGLVEERLAVWSLFPPPLQKEWLEMEETAQLGALTAVQRQRHLASLKPEERAALEAGLARWRALTESQRRETCEQFDSFFTLSEREQRKILGAFSETERQQMEQTLVSFEKLPDERRRTCVRSFEKFANLGLAERQQFLKNAERWRQMSQAEREAWRNLVKTANDWPPLPPGLDKTQYPPLPQPPFPVTPTNSGG